MRSASFACDAARAILETTGLTNELCTCTWAIVAFITKLHLYVAIARARWTVATSWALHDLARTLSITDAPLGSRSIDRTLDVDGCVGQACVDTLHTGRAHLTLTLIISTCSLIEGARGAGRRRRATQWTVVSWGALVCCWVRSALRTVESSETWVLEGLCSPVWTVLSTFAQIFGLCGSLTDVARPADLTIVRAGIWSLKLGISLAEPTSRTRLPVVGLLAGVSRLAARASLSCR